MIKMNNLVKSVLFTGLIIIFLSSCNLTKKYEEEEAEEIQNYLAEHPDLDFELKAKRIVLPGCTVGTGDQPVTHDTAFVYYTGYYLDGTEFDSNVGR